MKVEVTAEDIAKGKPLDPYICPVGLAVARALGVDLAAHFASGLWNNVGYAVFRRTITLGHCSDWPAPSKVGVFISAYENGEAVEPFTFDIPQEALTRGGL